MRRFISTLVVATVLTACGSVAASTRTASGPLVEDRSYDRIEELRLRRSDSPAERPSRLRLLDEMFNPTTVASAGSTRGPK